eukprot:352987-Chlamydomonas_euryale.AAC.19
MFFACLFAVSWGVEWGQLLKGASACSLVTFAVSAHPRNFARSLNVPVYKGAEDRPRVPLVNLRQARGSDWDDALILHLCDDEVQGQGREKAAKGWKVGTGSGKRGKTQCNDT